MELIKRFTGHAPVLAVLILCSGILCIGCRTPHSGTMVKNVKLTPFWPEWKQLPEFRNAIPLPSLYTENADKFQDCCISGTSDIDTADPNVYVDDKCLDLIPVMKQIKATLASLMAGAVYPDKKEALRETAALLSTWHGIVFGMKYIYIPTDSIKLHFQNDNCAVPDTAWYKRGRKIAVGAALIDSIILISEDKLPEKSVELLHACFKERNLVSRFDLAFELVKSPKNYYKITVRNIVYAIRTISPYVREMHFTFDTLYAGKKYSFNGFSFSIENNRNSSSMYYFNIDPPRGRRMRYCGVMGENRAFAVNEKCIGSIQPERTGYGFRADVAVSIIGIKQSQIQDIFN